MRGRWSAGLVAWSILCGALLVTGACSDSTRPSTRTFMLDGDWEWTETLAIEIGHPADDYFDCADSGLYVFTQAGTTFTGTSDQVGRCHSRAFPIFVVGNDSRGVAVTQGTITDTGTGWEIHFVVGVGDTACTYDGAASGAGTVALAGTTRCAEAGLATATGSWEAHRPLPLDSIVIRGVPTLVVPGDSVRLTADLYDISGASLHFRPPPVWSSSDASIATVDDSGHAAAIGPGRAMITAQEGTVSAQVALDVTGTIAGVTQTDLGTLGGPSSRALGVNATGEVAGWSAVPSGDQHAFRWTAADGMVDLGTLGGRWSTAAAINDAGQIVGTSAAADGSAHAFRWTASHGMEDLGPGEATAISGDGHVVGVDDSSHARLWDPSGTALDLGALPSDPSATTYENATGINDALQVIGSQTVVSNCDPYYGCDVSLYPFLWTSAGGITALQLPDGAEAYGINAAGDIAGTIGTSFAFVRKADGTVHQLPYLDYGTQAWAIGSLGQVAGCANVHPTVWAPDLTFSLLSFQAGCARGVSGDRIVGDVYAPGSTNSRATLWTVPAATYSFARSVPSSASRTRTDRPSRSPD